MTKQEKIVELVAEWYGITPKQVYSKSRKAPLVAARQIAMKIMKESLEMHLTQIGKVFKKDHTTVIHGIKTINNAFDTNHKPIINCYSWVSNKVMQEFDIKKTTLIASFPIGYDLHKVVRKISKEYKEVTFKLI
jgi:hypothetical protein